MSESVRRDRELDTERVWFPNTNFFDVDLTVQQGVYTGRENQAATDDTLPNLLDPVKEYGAAFSEKAQTLVQQLQVHPDLDCRFLAVRLNFSDFYRSRKDHR